MLNTNSRITAHKNYRKSLMSIQCYLTLYNTHHPAEKLGLPDKSPEPHAIIKPIIYLSFLTCMKNMKNSEIFLLSE